MNSNLLGELRIMKDYRCAYGNNGRQYWLDIER